MSARTTLRCWEIGAGIPMGDGRTMDCSQPEVIGDERYHATIEAAEEYAQDLRDTLGDTDLDPRTEYDVTETVLHDHDAYDVARRWTDEQREAAGWARCESGEWSGERCEIVEPTERLVRVRYVPNSDRGTATAARTWLGVARILYVCEVCADQMAEHDGEWTERVG